MAADKAEILLTILLNGRGDLRRLKYFKKYMDDALTSNITLTLTKQIIKALGDVVTGCSTPNNLDLESFEMLLKILLLTVRNSIDVTEWNNFESVLGELILKILTGIERAENFQVFFCKLISSISLICQNGFNMWRQVVRPFLNVFINKKFDFSYLEEALLEFKSICGWANKSEMVTFAKQNADLLRGFSVLVPRIGDFVTQMRIVDLILSHVSDKDISTMGLFMSHSIETRSLIKKLQFINFKKDSRAFLNALNSCLGLKKKVISVNCNTVYLGSVLLRPPLGIDGIWLDINKDSRRITISCADFYDNSRSIIIQIPLDEVKKLKLECGTLSEEECYCITIRIDRLQELYEFTNSRSLICTALSHKNLKQAILDFFRLAEELSDKRKWSKQKNETKCVSASFASCIRNDENKSSCKKIESYASKSNYKLSCTSPILFATETNSLNKKNNSLDNGTVGHAEIEYCQPTSSKSLLLNSYPEIKLEKQLENHPHTNESSLFDFPTTERDLQVHQVSSSAHGSRRTFYSLSTSDLPQISFKKCYFKNNEEMTTSRNIFVERNQHSESGALTVQCIDWGTEPLKVIEGQKKHRNFSSTRKYLGPKRFEKDLYLAPHDNSQQKNNVRINSSEPNIKSEKCTSSKGKEKNNHTRSGSVIHVQRERETSSVTVELKNTFNKEICLNNDFSLKTEGSSKQRRIEQVSNISLLDPNGYSFRRWKMATTSSRSNFWLNKLKSITKENCEPVGDVFNFATEDRQADSSEFLEKKPVKTKKVQLKRIGKHDERKKQKSAKETIGVLVENKKSNTDAILKQSLSLNHSSPLRIKKQKLAARIRLEEKRKQRENLKTAVEKHKVQEKSGGIWEVNNNISKTIQIQKIKESQERKGSKAISDSDDRQMKLKNKKGRKNNKKISTFENNYSRDEKLKQELLRADSINVIALESKGKPCLKEIGFYSECKTLNVQSMLQGNHIQSNMNGMKAETEYFIRNKTWATSKIGKIMEKVSTEMDRLLMDLSVHQAEGVTGYMKQVKQRIRGWIKKHSDYGLRLRRLDNCIEYFAIGCSVTNLNNNFDTEIKNWHHNFGLLLSKQGFKQKMSYFSAQLRQLLLDESELIINKRANEFRVRLNEFYLNPGLDG